MTNYIDSLIADELVRFAENDSVYEDAVKAMGAAILGHYFSIMNGFAVVPEQNRNNNYADFIILRVQRRFLGDRGMVDHTLAEAKKAADSVAISLEQLENALEHANTEFGRCWAILIHGANFHFYEYHVNLPSESRLVPWGTPEQPRQHVYHARHDSDIIHRMLLHMAQTDSPAPR